MVRLQDCCTVVGGATPKRAVEKYWAPSDVPWVTPKDISGLDKPVLEDAPEYISKAGFDSCATYMLPQGSILLTSRAPIGNVAIAGRDMCTNQGFKSLIPGPDVDPTYLYYCIQKNAIRLDNLGNGATFKEVSKKVVENFEIPLPPFCDQRRIAAILDKADNLRRKRQQAIQLADEFLRAVFLDMFGDPISNARGFHKGPVTELAEVVTGYAFKSGEYVDDSPAAVRLCRGANTLPGYFDWQDTKYWPQDRVSEVENYRINAGDIILAMDRPWISGGLKVCVFPDGQRPTYLVQRVARLRPKDPIYTDFIYSCIKSKSFERHCCPTETTIPHISPVELKSFEVQLPRTELVHRYHDVVSRSKAHLERALKFASEADLAFNSLSQSAFSGEL